MATKKTTKKTTTKKATPKKKDGLRKPQIRILQALAKSKASGLSRNQIAEKAPCDVAGCTEWIGSSDPSKRAQNDKKHFPSLLFLKYIKEGTPSEDGTSYYALTALGRKAIK